MKGTLISSFRTAPCNLVPEQFLKNPLFRLPLIAKRCAGDEVERPVQNLLQAKRSKQAREIIFSKKLKKTTHPPMLLNNSNVSQVNSQKHLAVILDVKLKFEEHLKNVFNKTNKTIGHLRKPSNLLPRQALATTYKALVRPHLDYGDVLYDQAFIILSTQKWNPSNIMPV